ncbi:hypothetical protein GOV11_04110 [Candidatus Woesearchaeota archaeon]|nr:hypothetical protein [Candidatus Woesearchaeota archaeon]
MGGGGPQQQAVDTVGIDIQGEKNRLKAAQERSQDDRRRKFLEESRQARERDLKAGRERGQELFGAGSFGTREEQSARTTDFADVLERRRAKLEGFTPEEQQAFREQVLGGAQKASETQLRRLRGEQASSGVRGGLASAQRGQLLRGAQRQEAEAERDIFLRQVAAREQGLSQFERTLGEEQKRAQAEKFGQLSTEFGFAALGSAERGASLQALVGEKQADVAQQRVDKAEGGKK